MRARRLACRCWAGRVVLRENRAPTHRLTAPRRSEAGAPKCLGMRPARAGSRVVRGQHALGVVSFPLRTSAREGRMTVTIGRRELLVALGGAAAAWPFAARAQQPGMARRIGVLIQVAEGDPQARIEVATFVRGLQELGWSEGRNLRIDTRWGGGDADRIRKYAAELV